jgi:hypothetical protein
MGEGRGGAFSVGQMSNSGCDASGLGLEVAVLGRRTQDQCSARQGRAEERDETSARSNGTAGQRSKGSGGAVEWEGE